MFPNIGKLSSLRTLSVFIVSLEEGNSLTELRDLNLGGKLSIDGLNHVVSLSEAQEANLMGKKDLQELCLFEIWRYNDDGSTKTRTFSAEQLLQVLQPHSNLKSLKIWDYNGLLLPNWISSLSNLVSLKLGNCEKFVQLPVLGKLQSLKELVLQSMDNLKYLDDDDVEYHNGMEARVFPNLEELELSYLPNLEGLLKVERGMTFHCLSRLEINYCPKLGPPCLPSLKNLCIRGCNNELLRSISNFCGLTDLALHDGEGITSFPEGTFKNLTCLQSLFVADFPKLKELPNEPFNPALTHPYISNCNQLESFGTLSPERVHKRYSSRSDARRKQGRIGTRYIIFRNYALVDVGVSNHSTFPPELDMSLMSLDFGLLVM